MIYAIRFTKQASKDIRHLTPKLQQKLKNILREQIAVSPYSGKMLVGLNLRSSMCQLTRSKLRANNRLRISSSEIVSGQP
jgi:mRNA-degrading endonuclease RelE of RelBE toxin-antitoxin system